MALSWVELALSRISCFLPVMSISCSLVVTCWERVDLLAPLYVMLSCCFCHLPIPYHVLGHVWYLIVSIPGLCFLLYFAHGQYAVTPVRLKSATLLSRLKHSTTGYCTRIFCGDHDESCRLLLWPRSKRSRSNISYKCWREFLSHFC